MRLVSAEQAAAGNISEADFYCLVQLRTGSVVVEGNGDLLVCVVRPEQKRTGSQVEVRAFCGCAAGNGIIDRYGDIGVGRLQHDLHQDGTVALVDT